jgi:hypothetical protein
MQTLRMWHPPCLHHICYTLPRKKPARKLKYCHCSFRSEMLWRYLVKLTSIVVKRMTCNYSKMKISVSFSFDVCTILSHELNINHASCIQLSHSLKLNFHVQSFCERIRHHTTKIGHGECCLKCLVSFAYIYYKRVISLHDNYLSHSDKYRKINTRFNTPTFETMNCGLWACHEMKIAWVTRIKMDSNCLSPKCLLWTLSFWWNIMICIRMLATTFVDCVQLSCSGKIHANWSTSPRLWVFGLKSNACVVTKSIVT